MPAKPTSCAPHPSLAIVRILAELLDDIEDVRVANGARIAALERATGEAPDVLTIVQLQLAAVEKLAVLDLKRAWRTHPLAPWAKGLSGVGEKQIARLIAATGDPAERPNVAKFWAFCGHGDPARKRRKGMSQEEALALGSPEAKMRTRLIAAKCMMLNGEPDKLGRPRVRSPYRDVYDDAKLKWAGRDTTDGHKHNHALRIVGKVFLKDLWVAAQSTRAAMPIVGPPAPGPEETR